MTADKRNTVRLGEKVLRGARKNPKPSTNEGAIVAGVIPSASSR